MEMERFDDDLNIIAGLGDDPKRDDGLSTQGFKSIFDKAGLLIQDFINNKLIPFIEKQNVGLPLGGGTMEGPINMNGQPLSGLNAPTADDQAANMGFVNQQMKKAAPRNLLDNSDFTQFIAQAGIGGNHGTQAYAGDRWILDSGTATGETNENGNGYFNIMLNGTIRQKIANPPAEGTVFVEMVSGTATAVYADGEVTVTSNGGVIKNIALYAGEYTVENKPAYQPKDYGAELNECLRYYYYFGGGWIYGAFVTGSGFAVPIYAPVVMRVDSPTLITSTPEFINDSSEWQSLINGRLNSSGANLYRVLFDDVAEATKGIQHLVRGIIALSADL